MKKIVESVILAAGKGVRMEYFSSQFPKGMLPVGNKPLMYYQIEEMKRLGIKKIFVVIGHLGHSIVKYFGNGSNFGVNIEYIDQGDTLGIAHAVSKLEPYITSPFFLFLGDIFFITNDLTPMLHLIETEEANAVLATKIETNLEAIKRNFLVIPDENGYVKRVIEKPRYFSSNNIKGCGIYLFDFHIFDAVRRTPRTAMKDEYEITDSIQILIDDGFNVKKADVIQDDINLSFPCDLLECNIKLLKMSDKSKIIGRNTHFPSGTKIYNSVIGENVRINFPIKISNSVILSDSKFSLKKNIDKSIITRDRIINCDYLHF